MSTTSPPPVIISDTSCLILLTNIGQLDLLRQLFGTVLITPTVAAEYGQPLPDWLRLAVPNGELPEAVRSSRIHAGEYSALVLALETPGSLVVLDDSPARQVAAQLRLAFTGTVGLLALAKTRGLLPRLRPVVAQLRTHGMWLSEAVAERVCREAGE